MGAIREDKLKLLARSRVAFDDGERKAVIRDAFVVSATEKGFHFRRLLFFIVVSMVKRKKGSAKKPRGEAGLLAFAKRRLRAELLDVRPTLLGVGFALGEEFLGLLGVDDRKHGVTGLVHDEVAEFRVIRFDRAIDHERALALLFEARVVMEAVEVTAFDGRLLLLDGVDEATLDVLLGAGAVADDEGRAVVGFRFAAGFAPSAMQPT